MAKRAALAAAPLLVVVTMGARLDAAVVDDTAPPGAGTRPPHHDADGALALSAAVGAIDFGTLYGDPRGAAPYWHHQSYDDDCAEMAVADVVGLLTGHEPTEQQIVTMAETTPSTAHPGPIYDPRRRGGTNNLDVGVLLTGYGIHAVTSDNEAPTGAASTDIDSLEQSLAHGQKAIVGVNANILWHKSAGDHTKENHFVVVTGIEPNAGVVHLNDSGIANGQDEQVSIGVFSAAWATSHDERTVTDPLTACQLTCRTTGVI